MRTLILMSPFLLLSPAAIADDVPFSPLPDVVDYVATFRSDEKIPDQRTVHHHGAWTKVEQQQGDDRTTTYSNAALPLTITVDPADEEYPRLTIVTGRLAHENLGLVDHPSRSKERDIVLGEPCEIWELEDYRRSCVTADGIELWKRLPIPGDPGTKAVALERRAVAESDVLPPPDIFDWKTWAGPALDSASGTDADAMVTLEASSENASQRAIRTVTRRHHEWSYYERFEGEVRRTILINNKETGLALRFDTYPDGKSARLWIVKLRKDASGRQPIPVAPLKSRAGETILGEVCTWFTVKSEPKDTRQTECNTTDGLTLKKVLEERGGATTSYVATRIERTPLSLADVSPPPSIFDQGNWGIPAR